jgi:hypothetical protein
VPVTKSLPIADALLTRELRRIYFFVYFYTLRSRKDFVPAKAGRSVRLASTIARRFPLCAI